MNVIYAEYNTHHNSIVIATTAGYLLRIDCWEAEKRLKTTPGSECALNTLAIDEPLEYARLYLEGNMGRIRAGISMLPGNSQHIHALCAGGVV